MTVHDRKRIMLTTRGVAQLLNVHINTVRRWSNQGILKAYRVGPRGDRRFKREDIDAFLVESHKDAREIQKPSQIGDEVWIR